MARQVGASAVSLALGALFIGGSMSAAAAPFDMVVSAGAKDCLPNAKGEVKISPVGPIDFMVVSIDGMPPNKVFDLFVIQVPKAPFGIAWYQGDIQTDDQGHGQQYFAAVFGIETFCGGAELGAGASGIQWGISRCQLESSVQPDPDVSLGALV